MASPEPPPPPAAWLLTPLVAFTATLVGVVAVAFAETELVPSLGGGCAAGTPECVLRVGVQLLVFGFFALCCSAIAGPVVAMRHKSDAQSRPAVRRGLWVALWCVGGFAMFSVVAWW